MRREWALKILLALMGLAFVAGIYPLVTSLFLRRGGVSEGDQMILGIYFTLGIFILLAVRTPSAHRSLIAFAGWANIAHATVMIAQGIQTGDKSQLPGIIVIGILSIILLLLLLPKHSARRALADGR